MSPFRKINEIELGEMKFNVTVSTVILEMEKDTEP